MSHHPSKSKKKCISSESGEKYSQIKHCLLAKIIQNTSKQKISLDFDVREQQGMNFFTGECIDRLKFIDSYKHTVFHFTRC